MGSVSRKKPILRMNQTYAIDQNTVTEMKNALISLFAAWTQLGKISELEDITIDTSNTGVERTKTE